MEIKVTDAFERSRYEARLEGEGASESEGEGEVRDPNTVVGFLDYAIKHDRLVLIHTEVPPAFGGRGIGSALARFALADARRRGIRVIPSCPYVRAYLERHPEERDVVAGG